MKKRYLSLLLIALLLCLALSCNTDVGNDSETLEEATSWQEAMPLHERYSDYFLMGNIISPGDLNDTTRFGYLKRHFNTVTAENHMKPDNIAPSSSGGAYKWNDADRIVDAALAEGMKVHGHTLIWHQQTPGWLSSGNSTTALANLENYVTDVVIHFKGKVISWDVVNEAFSDNLGSANPANWRSCLRDSPWKTSVGTDYIEKAFLAARAADPNAKLYYNDYSLNNANKAQAVYHMVNYINTVHSNVSGRPLIDGIGMQSHHNIATSIQSVETSIKLFASLGVEVSITELDILANNGGDINDPRLGSEWNDSVAQQQAQQYAAMFRIFKKYRSNIGRVTFWGIDDGTSWRGANHATMLNSDYSLKPAFYAVANPNRY